MATNKAVKDFLFMMLTKSKISHCEGQQLILKFII